MSNDNKVFYLSEEDLKRIMREIHEDGFNSGYDFGFEEGFQSCNKDIERYFENIAKTSQEEFLLNINLGRAKH